jgi:hypothetical protein
MWKGVSLRSNWKDFQAEWPFYKINEKSHVEITVLWTCIWSMSWIAPVQFFNTPTNCHNSNVSVSQEGRITREQDWH